MKKMENKDRCLQPILVKNTYKNESSKSFINIAPFLDSIEYVEAIAENPMEVLGEFVGNLARIIATASLEGAMVIQGYSKEEIVYSLFYLEDGLKKSTLVNM